MKNIALKSLFIAVLFLMSVGTASATIETIKGTLACFVGCNKTVVQLVAQNTDYSFEVVGQFVDLSTRVEITPSSGISVSYGTRKGGSNSSIIVKIDVDNAAPGERTVKMRYAIETNGPDTFKIRVVPRGTITQIQYSKPLPFRPGGGPARELVAPTGMPLNERVILKVTGTKLSNVQVRQQSTFRSARVLPNATDTEANIEIEFSSAGQGPLLLFDEALSAQDMNSSTSSRFSYTGSPTIQYGGNQSSGSSFVSRPIRGGSSGGAGGGFIDAAPRVTMTNIFRRQSRNAAFTENGVQYFSIDSQQFCNGMNGNQTRIINVPNLTWGVTNVGTAPINTPFTAQLRSGGAILATENIASLDPGETRSFNFARQSSQARVFTFLIRNGCFVAPTANPFFEDPQFTVVVDPAGALGEAATNRNNNSRNF